MSNVFRTYVSDFKESLADARKKIQEAQTVDGDAKRIALVDAEKARREAESLIKQMQLAVRTAQGAEASRMQSEIDGFRAECQNLQRDIDALRQRYQRAELLGGTDEEAITSLEDRAKLRGDTQRLNAATGQLQGAVATAQGALNTGVATLDELARQRERMEGARTGLGDIRGLIRDSQRIIKAMWNSNYAETAIKLGIIIVLIAFIAIIAYLRWGRAPAILPPAMTPHEPRAPISVAPYTLPPDIFTLPPDPVTQPPDSNS